MPCGNWSWRRARRGCGSRRRRSLARLVRDRGDVPSAIDWFERAAEAPAPTPEAGRALLYELGQALEELRRSRARARRLSRASGRRGRLCRPEVAHRAPVAGADGELNVRQLVYAACFFEVGLLLVVLPWTAFWDRNYLFDAMPLLQG